MSLINKKVSEFKAPEWSQFVKSGVSKERPIEEEDFFGNVLKPFEEITRKPVSPSEEEIAGTIKIKIRY